MKEFIFKHPIISFLLADSLIAGAYNTICFVASCFRKNDVAKEVTADEPANDIQ